MELDEMLAKQESCLSRPCQESFPLVEACRPGPTEVAKPAACHRSSSVTSPVEPPRPKERQQERKVCTVTVYSCIWVLEYRQSVSGTYWGLEHDL
eukprot:2920637-Amphidinium_carterae.1